MGATQMRFWKVRERIWRGLKSVGGFGDRALPAGGDCMGVKYGAFGAGVLTGAIAIFGVPMGGGRRALVLKGAIHSEIERRELAIEVQCLSKEVVEFYPSWTGPVV